MDKHASEVAAGQRFEFGANWKNFLGSLDEQRILDAERSLQRFLGKTRLDGLRFLDIGSGSGLFSLAAWRLGATVHSFDFDPQSVECTRRLKQSRGADDGRWKVQEGSVLDRDFVGGLGEWDIVYSWGVLHHTGRMWDALENAAGRVACNGLLYIAIYNRQPMLSSYWVLVKKTYNRSPWPVRQLMKAGFVAFFATELFAADAVRGRNPFGRYHRRGGRGMNLVNDVVDWIGGWPFEVASPEEIFRHFRERSFVLEEMSTCGGRHGCNQFVFKKSSAPLN